jgi:hypothetical protein
MPCLIAGQADLAGLLYTITGGEPVNSGYVQQRQGTSNKLEYVTQRNASHMTYRRSTVSPVVAPELGGKGRRVEGASDGKPGD